MFGITPPSSDRPPPANQATSDGLAFSDRAIPMSQEWQRINALPWRTWTIAEGKEISDRLSPALKTPAGRQSLMPIQAVYLKEAWELAQDGYGAFGDISVSAGKTLISLFLAQLIDCERPVLYAPAKLLSRPNPNQLSKTEKEILEYSKHWNLKKIPVLRSYESVGVVSGKDSLDELNPDLVILDEAHKLRNPQASRTKRFSRYFKSHPNTKVFALTGSSAKRSIADYAHILDWCLRDRSPAPREQHVVEDWDLCLGEKLDMAFSRLSPGPLMQWARQGDVEALGLLNAARAAYQRRYSSTKGVICYHVAAEDIGVPIEVNPINLWELPGYHADCTIEQAFDVLRGKMELPDGQELVEGVEIYQHAREEKLGFYTKWKYPAPAEWMLKRKAFGSFVRSHLAGNSRYDSPEEVVLAFPLAQEVVEWKAIKDSYKPETIIIWIDSGPVLRCVDWLKEGGIVIVQHVAFGEALAQLAGVPYFGAGGVDARKQSIEHFQGKSCVASMFANGEGRNLHFREHPANPAARLGFKRMLLTSVPRNGPELEQVIGRIHRLHCLADKAVVDVLVGCAEDVTTFEQCIRDSEFVRYAGGGVHKILQASIGDFVTTETWPREFSAFSKSKAKRACARDLDVTLFGIGQ